MKFNWNGIDEKYKWFAIDARIGGYVFENKPRIIQDTVWDVTNGDVYYVGGFGSHNWRDSLQERPSKTFDTSQCDKIVLDGKWYHLVPVEKS